MADQRRITLYQGHATPKTIILRPLPVATLPLRTTIYLYPGHATPKNIILRNPLVAIPPSGFPTQFFGLKAFFQGAIKDLCLVAEADAPTGMGGVIKILKGASKYVAYLVEISDPNATPIRFNTTTGVKAIRIKT